MRNTFIVACILFRQVAFSQHISYSEPRTADSSTQNIEIIGKVEDNIFVYERTLAGHALAFYDNEMKFRGSSDLVFLNKKKIVYLNFIPYPHFCLSIFQIREKNMFYCKVAKLDNAGKLMEIKTIDSAQSDIFEGGEMYAVSVSENKKYILFNRPLSGLKENALQMDQVTIDENLTIKRNEHYFIPFEWNKQFLTAASIDNNGNVIFITWKKADKKSTSITFYKSPARGYDLEIRDITVNKYSLMDAQLKINNEKNSYYIVSFYKNIKGGNTLGLLSMILKSDLTDFVAPRITSFTKEEKKMARTNIPSSQSFNDYLLNDLVIKKDGGFVVTTTINRDQFISPTPGSQGNNVSIPGVGVYLPIDYGDLSYYSYVRDVANGNRSENAPLDPFLYTNHSAASLPPPQVNSSQQIASTGSHGFLPANVMTFSFDKNNHAFATNRLNNFVPSAFLTFYNLSVLDNQLVFVYNNLDKDQKTTLRSFSVFYDGTTLLNPLFRNLSQSYIFFPAKARQVDEKTIIIPCEKDNHMAIAKITFNKF